MSEKLPVEETRPERLPEVLRALDQYLDDIRCHQSMWPLSRRRLRRRYRTDIAVSCVVTAGPSA
jgi:hypothetical protein